jgi:small conductance mechanosensitive channel
VPTLPDVSTINQTNWPDLLLRFGINVLAAIAILVIGWLVGSWLERQATKVIRRSSGVDTGFTPALAKIVKYVAIALSVIAVLGRFGVQTASITALIGAAGLTIGLALQGTLSNVAAGIMLIALRPFKLGDGVDISGTAGQIADMGLFVTRLVTWDGVVVYLPNSTVWGSRIMNYTQAGRRRFDLTIGLAYEDDIGRALQVLAEVVGSDTRVLVDPAPTYAVKALSDTAVTLLARFWTKAGDFQDTQFDLVRAVKERFDNEGLTIPVKRFDIAVVQGSS